MDVRERSFMHPDMYAVVNADSCGQAYRFSKWHDNFDTAKAEATRLAKQEGTKFYVIKVIGYAEVVSVNWVDL